MKVLFAAFAIALIFLISHAECSIGCIDENGKAVDWWVIMKVPYLPSNADPTAASGYAYSYADSNNPALKYTGLRLDTNSKGALANTINQIYQADKSNTGWCMYDDQPPDGSSHDSYGHTKGDCCYDESTGYWLVHSVPRWPTSPPSSYSFPDYEKDNGQSFLCMTFNTPTFDTIYGQFLLNKPYIYSSNTNSYFNSTLPNMVNVLNKKFDTSTSKSNIVNLTTKGGNVFRSFAKNSAWNESLYENLVSPNLKSGLLCETWQNGSGGKQPSYCTPQYAFDSMNIQYVQLTNSIGWSETVDHSKWAVTSDIQNWLCIGDINRMDSQNTRAGGTVCFNNPSMFKAFSAIISKADYC